MVNTKVQRRSMGLCVRCGKAPARPGQTACDPCAKEQCEGSLDRRRRIKQTVLSHYGRSCSCCGEAESMFLSIDHMDGQGAKHRQENNLPTGWNFYRWLIRQGFPEGFQTLCHNCNMGRHINGGVCPHQEKK